MNVTKQLNAKGLLCPMPTVKTSIALDMLSSGDVLEVVVTDKTSCRDLPRWVETTGNTLLEIKTEGEISHIFIQKN